MNSNEPDLHPSYNLNLPFNESQKKIIGSCGNENGREWCVFDDYDKSYKQELNLIQIITRNLYLQVLHLQYPTPSEI